MPLTPEEERRLQDEFDRATEEARRAGERASLRRLIASRTRKLLERDYGEAEQVLADEGIVGAISRMASRLLSSVIERWTREMRPLLEDIAETVTEPKEDILGVGFDVSNPRMESFLDERVSELVNTTSDTTYRQVMEALREAQDEGLSVDETAERIREKSRIQSRYRSRLIARTELHATSIGASYHQAVESGVVKSKTWRTVRDADVRDAHRDLEGVTVGITEFFPNGLLFPIEPNCRCYLEFGVDFDALEESDPERFAGLGDNADDDPGSGRGSGGDGGTGGGRDGGGTTPPEYLDLDRDEAALEFDREINGPRSLGGENSPTAQRHLQDISDRYYDEIYDDDDLQREARDLVAKWSEDRQENPYREEVVSAWIRTLQARDPETDLDSTVSELYATREERWERLSERTGIEMPEGFRVFRGVRGEGFVEDVVNAWRDSSNDSFRARAREASSWSLRRQAAYNFATRNGRDKDAAVIWDTDVPFTQTLADKLVDDGRFVVPFKSQWEIIVGDETQDTIFLPVERVSVVFRGREYDYDDRYELISAWESR